MGVKGWFLGRTKLCWLAGFALCMGAFSCQPEPSKSSVLTKSVEKESMASVGERVQECRVCHGVEEAQRGPILDGMEYWYLYEQIQKFHSGIRGKNPQNRSEHLMGIGVRKKKNNLEIAYLADWFAKQEPKPAVRTVVGDLERGRLFYEARCASCHGEKAQGNRLVGGPALNRLEGWYFLEQMRKFRSGMRGYHRDDIDGKTMQAASKDITDGTLKDVVAYIVNTHGPEDAPRMFERIVPKKSPKPF